jgi:hypothetical protein
MLFEHFLSLTKIGRLEPLSVSDINIHQLHWLFDHAGDHFSARGDSKIIFNVRL